MKFAMNVKAGKPAADGSFLLVYGDGKCVTKAHVDGCNSCHPFACFWKACGLHQDIQFLHLHEALEKEYPLYFSIILLNLYQ